MRPRHSFAVCKLIWMVKQFVFVLKKDGVKSQTTPANVKVMIAVVFESPFMQIIVVWIKTSKIIQLSSFCLLCFLWSNEKIANQSSIFLLVFYWVYYSYYFPFLLYILIKLLIILLCCKI